MEVSLTLRAVSGYWTPPTQTAYANTDLKIKLNDNGQIKDKAVLFFNGAAFLFDEHGELVIPANKLKETNYCVLQEKNDFGGTVKEWNFIETLFFDLDKLDKQGEKRMLSEREFFKKLKEDFVALAEEYKKEKEMVQMFAAELIKQGKVIAEMQKDIEAVKNEPVI